MEFTIASKADKSAIVALHAQSWREAYKTILSDDFLQNSLMQNRLDVWTERFDQPKDNQYIVVAYDNNELCGFICAYGNEHPKWGTFVDNLHVTSVRKGQGIGKSLMQNVIDWSKLQYFGKGMYLEVLADNTSAQRFYDGLGAVNQGEAYWQPPEGQPVKEFLYVWESLDSYGNKYSGI